MPCIAVDTCDLRRTFRRTYDAPDIRDEDVPSGVYCEFVDVYELDAGRFTWRDRIGTGRRYEVVGPCSDLDLMTDVEKRLKEI